MSEKVNPTSYDPVERKQALADEQRILAWEGDSSADDYGKTLDDLAEYFASRPENDEENAKYKDSLDKTLSKLEDGSRADEIISKNRELKFAVMLARNAAKLKASKVEDLNQDKTLDEVIDAVHDKEVKVDEILAKYIETTDLADSDLEAVINRVHALMNEGSSEKDAPTASRDDNASDREEPEANESPEGSERVTITEEDLGDETEKIIVNEEDLDDDSEEVDGEIIDAETSSVVNADNEAEDIVDGDAETIEFSAVGQEVVPYEKPGLWQRLKNKYYGNFGHLHARFMEFQKGKKGALAVGLVLGAGAMYLMKKGDSETANVVTDNINIDTGGIDNSSIDTPVVPSGHEVVEPQVHDIGSSFSDAARHIDSGEGFYQTFKEMNIPQSEWSDLLDKVGPRLQEQGIAYPMGDSWGINMTSSGKMPDTALRIIENARANR